MLVETHMASSSMSVWWFSCASLGLWTVHSLRSIKGGGKRDSNLPGMTWMEHNNLEVDGRCELLMNPGHGWILPSAKDGWKIRWFFSKMQIWMCFFFFFFRFICRNHLQGWNVFSMFCILFHELLIYYFFNQFQCWYSSTTHYVMGQNASGLSSESSLGI